VAVASQNVTCPGETGELPAVTEAVSIIGVLADTVDEDRLRAVEVPGIMNVGSEIVYSVELQVQTSLAEFANDVTEPVAITFPVTVIGG